MKKVFILILLPVLFLGFFSCGTTSSSSTSSSSSSTDDVYDYFTVPERSDNMVFTVYSGYTFPTKMSDDDWNMLALALILGYDYCASYAGSSDMLAVGFLMTNNKGKVYIAWYNDYQDFINGKIDADAFLGKLTIEDLDL